MNLSSHRIQGRSIGRRPGASGAVCVWLVLALGWHPQAHAGGLGSVAASLGFFVALTALLMSQALPVPVSANALPMLGFTLLAFAAALLLWRTRGASFGAGVLPLAPRAVRLPVARRTVAAPVVLPEGIDREQLLADLRRQYVRLQAAWDTREVEVLRALTTPEMLAELCAQFPERHGDADCTEVVTLNAALLGFDEVGAAYLASVEFSGMIRERAEGGALPFRELWMLARPRHDGAEWQLARQLDLP
ncbi:MAG: Tim44-like domain-containing protein [Burkholderiaceae bacterium]